MRSSPLIILLSLVYLPLLFADTTSSDSMARGLEISMRMRSAQEGFIGEAARMQMIITDAHNNQVTREMNNFVKEVASEGDKSLLVFLTPADVKDTKLLTWSRREGDDDQWLFLPSMRRVRRISSSNRSSSFLGSEFTFEDLTGQEVERYQHHFLREDTFNEEPVYVIRRSPKGSSAYSFQDLFVSKSKLIPLRVDYYNRREELFKQALSDQIESYTLASGKQIWRANRIVMENLQTKKSSEFLWLERKLNVEHPDIMFTQAALSD